MEMSDAMNAEEMIEYVLCESRNMELPERDAALNMDCDQEVRLQRLRVAVERLVDDGTALEYPPDLARRKSLLLHGIAGGRSACWIMCPSACHSAGRISPWQPVSSLQAR